MRADWVPAHISHDAQGRRILDTAGGILIGLRRCGSEAAFHELHGAAQRHRIPVFSMAWALVHLASARTQAPKEAPKAQAPEALSTAQSAAHHEWGGLFAEPAVQPTGA